MQSFGRSVTVQTMILSKKRVVVTVMHETKTRCYQSEARTWRVRSVVPLDAIRFDNDLHAYSLSWLRRSGKKTARNVDFDVVLSI